MTDVTQDRRQNLLTYLWLIGIQRRLLDFSIMSAAANANIGTQRPIEITNLEACYSVAHFTAYGPWRFHFCTFHQNYSQYSSAGIALITVLFPTSIHLQCFGAPFPTAILFDRAVTVPLLMDSWSPKHLLHYT